MDEVGRPARVARSVAPGVSLTYGAPEAPVVATVEASETEAPRRKRGRPPGSKNKPKVSDGDSD